MESVQSEPRWSVSFSARFLHHFTICGVSGLFVIFQCAVTSLLVGVSVRQAGRRTVTPSLASKAYYTASIGLDTHQIASTPRASKCLDEWSKRMLTEQGLEMTDRQPETEERRERTTEQCYEVIGTEEWRK